MQLPHHAASLLAASSCSGRDGMSFPTIPLLIRAILTNEWDMAEEEVIEFYNQRGAKEKVFDQMAGDFGWHYLPKGLLRENTVFLLITAMLRRSALPLRLRRTSTGYC